MLRFLLAHIAAPLCRPSPEECAEDYAWFRERLADPGLLGHAVGVKVDGAVLVAVPAGGRRSGYLSLIPGPGAGTSSTRAAAEAETATTVTRPATSSPPSNGPSSCGKN